MPETPTLLIDSYAQIYRGYYAIRGLTNSSGEPSNAVFAMAKFLLKLHSDYPDSDGAFVFDEGKPAHRMEIAPLYKANRPPMPDDLKAQIPIISELIDAFGWNSIKEPSWEADDLIAVICSMLKDRKIYIISADKDLSQLIDQRVEMLVPDRDGKGLQLRGVQEVVDKFGVPPKEIVDYLALIGDSSDNIPGLEGVGPKTAAQLLNQFHSIDAMLSRADEIEKEKLREKVIQGADILRTNIELVKLVSTPPENCHWDTGTFHKRQPDFEKIKAIAEKMELRSILKELGAPRHPATVNPAPQEKKKAEPEKSAPEQMELF